MQGEWLTLVEAASELRVKPDTLRKWLGSGKARGQKLGKAWRIHRSEIERLLPPPTPEDPPGPS
jgi:excisionase family DNA binding protein